MNTPKKILLILCDYYVPTTKGRGPAKSIANVAAILKEKFDIYLLTRDRDYGAGCAYPLIRSENWNDLDGIRVRYLSPRELRPFRMCSIIANIKFDIVYLNSFFSMPFTIITLILRRVGWQRLRQAPLILAPRGELSDDALKIKRLKKNVYLAFAKLVQLYSNTEFHAESEREAEEIARNHLLFNTGHRAPQITFAPCPLPQANTKSIRIPTKHPTKLKVCFVARVSRIKNLDFALTVLRQITDVSIEFDVYGPAATPEDQIYQAECKRLSETLPINISVRFLGSADPESIIEIIAGYHLFFLPTQSENFGHAIFEALCAGRPVLISDQTPWRNLLASDVGWDLNLERPGEFVDVIRAIAALDSNQFTDKVRSIVAYLESRNDSGESARLTRQLFLTAADRKKNTTPP